jgi:hypothetical protein
MEGTQRPCHELYFPLYVLRSDADIVAALFSQVQSGGPRKSGRISTYFSSQTATSSARRGSIPAQAISRIRIRTFYRGHPRPWTTSILFVRLPKGGTAVPPLRYIHYSSRIYARPVACTTHQRPTYISEPSYQAQRATRYGSSPFLRRAVFEITPRTSPTVRYLFLVR